VRGIWRLQPRKAGEMGEERGEEKEGKTLSAKWGKHRD